MHFQITVESNNVIDIAAVKRCDYMANFSPVSRSARVAEMKVPIIRRRFQPGSKILARFQKPDWDFDNRYKYCCSIWETSYRPEMELPPTELGSFRYPSSLWSFSTKSDG